MKQLIFTQKIGYNLYSCCLTTRGEKKVYEVYEISGNKVLRTIVKGDQTMEELENLFFEISFNDFKKEVLKKANKF